MSSPGREHKNQAFVCLFYASLLLAVFLIILAVVGTPAHVFLRYSELISFLNRFARVGSVVLAVHDASDVFLEVGKISKYSGRQLLADVSFLLFVISWVIDPGGC